MEILTVRMMLHIVDCIWCVETARDWTKYQDPRYSPTVSEGIAEAWLDHLKRK